MASNEWDQFPQASAMDVALAAEGVTGSAADFVRSLHQQESSSGKNTKTSNAGAVGGMQVLPDTFGGVADKGWDINDPIHNARAGTRYAKQMLDAAGGDPAIAAAGYYGGPGGLEKARKGIAVSDPRNPNAPNTLEYGKQVAARLPSAAASAPAANQTPGAAVADDWSAFPEVKAGEATPGGATPPAAKPRSWIDDLGHQLGLTARAAVTGAASIPAMAADALIVAPANAAMSAYDKVAGNKEPSYRFKPQTQALNDVMTSAGVAVPETATERVVQDAASSVAGAGSMVKGGMALAKYAGGPVTKGVGEVLAAGPKLQLASAATGAGASGVVREGGGGEGAQIAAGLAGALAPSLVPAAVAGTVRGVLRGGEAGRQRIADNLETFKAAGVEPTLGQAAGGKLQRVEALVSKAPGGSGVVASYAQKQADDMAESVQRLSNELAPGANAMNAGEAITRGITAFKQGVKATQQKLYANLDNHIPAGTRITSERTQAALADLNTDIAGAPAMSKWFKNAKIQGLEDGLISDTSSTGAVLSRPGIKEQVAKMQAQLESDAARIAAANAERRQLGMKNLEPEITPAQIQEKIDGFLTKQIDKKLPYESVKKFRTLVGRELTDNGLTSDVPRSKWQALYAALSDDLGVAATKAGPEAEASWKWANQYTKSQMERLEQLSGIVSRDAPEKVFAAAVSGTIEGDTVIKRVINALPKQERREVAAAVLQRMGRATTGQQNAMGDAFSSETFLSNLNKLSPASRKTIFGRTDIKGIEEQVGNFAKVAEMRREGGKIFANPSGTASTGAQLVNASAIGSGITASIATGNPLPLLAATAPMVGANRVAKMLTNPKNVEALAKRTQLAEGTPSVVTAAVGRAASPLPGGPTNYDEFPAVEQAPAMPVQTSGAAGAPAEPTDAPVRIELNGMATPDPTDLVNGQDAPIEGADAEPEPTADAGQPDYDPATAFTSQPRPDGTLAISGDTQAMRAMLVKAGIPARSLTPMKDGLLIGRTQAARVQQAIERMQAAAAPAPQDGGQVDALANAAPQDQNPTMIPLQNDALAPADIAQPATQSIANVQDQQAPIGAQAQAAPIEAREAIAGDATAAQDVPGAGSLGGVQADGLGAQAPIDYAAHGAATSPQNELPEPTEGQKRAGNYRLGHDRIAGMDVAIENPQGSVRRGVDPDGKPWETQMQHHYGYFKKSTANDGDKLDVFIKPGTPKDFAGPVFVIDQVDPRTGKLDEHKTILGAATEDEAKAIYKSNYSDDWQGMGSITRLPMPVFKAWAASGSKKEPLGDLQASIVAPDSTAEGRGFGNDQELASGPDAQQPNADPTQAARMRIQKLQDSGETEVAGMLQKSFDREQARVTAPAELAAMRDTAPDLPHHQSQEFARTYAQLRNTGAKPAEAAARAGLLAAVTDQAPAIGLPQKAMDALTQQLGKIPLDDAPGFAQRFIAGLIKRGVMQDFQGAGQVGAMLAEYRDGSMNAMADAAYRDVGA